MASRRCREEGELECAHGRGTGSCLGNPMIKGQTPMYGYSPPDTGWTLAAYLLVSSREVSSSLGLSALNLRSRRLSAAGAEQQREAQVAMTKKVAKKKAKQRATAAKEAIAMESADMGVGLGVRTKKKRGTSVFEDADVEAGQCLQGSKTQRTNKPADFSSRTSGSEHSRRSSVTFARVPVLCELLLTRQRFFWR